MESKLIALVRRVDYTQLRDPIPLFLISQYSYHILHLGRHTQQPSSRWTGLTFEAPRASTLAAVREAKADATREPSRL